MATVTTDNPDATVTAPRLMALESTGARIVAASFMVASCLSILPGAKGGWSTVLVVSSIVVAGLGVAGIVAAWPDPMPVSATVAVAVTVPLSCLLTCIAIPPRFGNLNQLNVVGVGVAVCAFLCVRGRVRAAWWGQISASVVLIGWSVHIGQGIVLGIFLAGPNLAILGIATYFGIVMRPAAATISRLRAEAVAQTEEAAASEARLAERDRAQSLLRAVAWPALGSIARGEMQSADDVAAIMRLEARLRDSVRARALSVPSVLDAVWRARSRGITVVLLDDGASRDMRDFHATVCGWLDQAVDGTVTVRVHPPGRSVWGSVVAVDGRGAVRRIHVDDEGAGVES